MKRLVLPACACAAAVAINAGISSLNDQVDRNREALSYICSTTSVLDALVVTAAAQIEANFENGTYDKLLQQGIINRENVRAAQRTETKYRAAHATLKANGACRDVTK